MKQAEKLKELFDKIKEQSKRENYVKSELDVAAQTMGSEDFCNWVDQTLGELKEEEKESSLPPEV